MQCSNCKQNMSGFSKVRIDDEWLYICPRCGFRNYVVPNTNISMGGKEGMINKEAYIKKLPSGKWGVFSEDGKKLGEHETKEEATKQLQAIEISKHKSGAVTKQGKRIVMGDIAQGVIAYLPELIPGDEFAFVEDLRYVYKVIDTDKEGVVVENNKGKKYKIPLDEKWSHAKLVAVASVKYSQDFLDAVKDGLTVIAPAVAISGAWDLMVTYETFKKVLDNLESQTAGPSSLIPGYAVLKKKKAGMDDMMLEEKIEKGDYIAYVWKDTMRHSCEVEIEYKDGGTVERWQTIDLSDAIDEANEYLDDLVEGKIKAGLRNKKSDKQTYKGIEVPDNVVYVYDKIDHIWLGSQKGKHYVDFVVQVGDDTEVLEQEFDDPVDAEEFKNWLKGSIKKETSLKKAYLGREPMGPGGGLVVDLDPYFITDYNEMVNFVQAITPVVVKHAMETGDNNVLRGLGRLVTALRDFRVENQMSADRYSKDYDRGMGGNDISYREPVGRAQQDPWA